MDVEVMFRLLPGKWDEALKFECLACKSEGVSEIVKGDLDWHAAARHAKSKFGVDTTAVRLIPPGKRVLNPGFRNSLEDLINRTGKENGSNTPDFILARYLDGCLKIFDEAVRKRDEWYLNGNHLEPGNAVRIMSPADPHFRVLPSAGIDETPLFECQIHGCKVWVRWNRVIEHVKEHRSGAKIAPQEKERT